MKTKAQGTPMRVVDGEKLFFIDDMTRPVREAVRDYVGVHNPFDDEGCVTFKQYHDWMKTLDA